MPDRRFRLKRRQLLACGAAGVAAGVATLSAPGTFGAVAGSRAVLTVAAFPLVDQIARAAVPLWQQGHPDVEIKVMTRQYADHHTAMMTALSTSGLLPDVMALESSFVGRFAEGGGLQDLSLDPYRIGQFRERMVPYAYDQAISRAGAVVAMPADIGPGTMLYRTDLLSKAGIEPSALTQSWDSYLAAGRRIKAATGAYLIAHVQEIKDIMLRNGLKPGEGLYFDQDSRVLVTSERFVRAFEVAVAARRLKLDARVMAWSNEWAEGFKRGTLATELSGAWLVGQLSNWIAPQTRGLWRVAQLPEDSAAAYGGAFYAIPKHLTPERKNLAWAFIRQMTLERELQLSAFKKFDAFPALRASHDDAFFEQPVDFLGGQQARLLWRSAASKIQAAPVHKQNPFADEVVGTELDNVLNRGKSIRAALADAQRLIERRALR